MKYICCCADVAETLCYLLIGPDQAGASQSIEVCMLGNTLTYFVIFYIL